MAHLARCCCTLCMQSKLLTDQESSAGATASLKRALAEQQAVISRLEQLLAAAASRAKELEGWRATAEALQDEVARVRCAGTL